MVSVLRATIVAVRKVAEGPVTTNHETFNFGRIIDRVKNGSESPENISPMSFRNN